MGPKINIDMTGADFKTTYSGYTEEEIAELLARGPSKQEEIVEENTESILAKALNKTLEENIELKKANSAMKEEISFLNMAIVMLKDYVKANGLREFGSDDLDKAPKEMSPSELRQRNNKIKVLRAKSNDALPMPTPEELEKKYKEQCKEMLSLSSTGPIVSMFVEDTEEL